MNNWLVNYFGFSKRECRGIYLLMVILAILMVFPTLHTWFQAERKEVVSALDEREINAFLASTNRRSVGDAREKEARVLPVSMEKVDYFEFDPNSLSQEQGLDLGLSERQVRMIQNYVAKGGKFYKKEDFGKIYAISASDYARLAPYIRIPAREDSQMPTDEGRGTGNARTTDVAEKEERPNLGFTASSRVDTKNAIIELNSTDSIQLQQLRGIGPVFASRIIKFRDGLGGFYDASQLLEVYGMDEERFEGIKNQLLVDSSLVRKININSIAYEQLVKHSLVSYKQANAIVQYRKQHGDFVTIKDLSKIGILNEDFLLKIAPYIYFSE